MGERLAARALRNSMHRRMPYNSITSIVLPTVCYRWLWPATRRVLILRPSKNRFAAPQFSNSQFRLYSGSCASFSVCCFVLICIVRMCVCQVALVTICRARTQSVVVHQTGSLKVSTCTNLRSSSMLGFMFDCTLNWCGREARTRTRTKFCSEIVAFVRTRARIKYREQVDNETVRLTML